MGAKEQALAVHHGHFTLASWWLQRLEAQFQDRGDGRVRKPLSKLTHVLQPSLRSEVQIKGGVGGQASAGPECGLGCWLRFCMIKCFQWLSPAEQRIRRKSSSGVLSLIGTLRLGVLKKLRWRGEPLRTVPSSQIVNFPSSLTLS